MKLFTAMSSSALIGIGLVLSTASASLATSLQLTGTIRDFRASGTLGGHPDFEYTVTGLETGIVKDTLGADGKPVYNGNPATPSTNGKAAFDQWYRDVAGVNQSQQYAITLEDFDGDGIYTYENSSFFPIDNQLFGNQGLPHNYHFTYEINSQFTYKKGQTFKFHGDDDVFVFINNKLAIDLGGVHPSVEKEITLDDNFAASYGLVEGSNYSFDFFFAERHTSQSNFRIETSLLLAPDTSVPEPATMSLLSLGLLGLGFMQSRKKSA